MMRINFSNITDRKTMLVLSLPMFASLLGAVLCADSPDNQHHRHLPDTAPDMDLKPAFQRSTEAPPPHRHHSHDFSLPLPGRSRTTEPYDDYEYLVETTGSYDEYATDTTWPNDEYAMETMRNYRWDASGDEEAGHDHDWTTDGDEGRDSLNDHFASDASENKLKSTLLLVLTVAFLLIT